MVRIALTPLRVVTGATGLRRIGRIDPHTEITARGGRGRGEGEGGGCRGGGGLVSHLWSTHCHP